ncbi:MAG: DUF58 domain-containing protein [Pirellulaceae bacterium]|jgi:uncharacterized protein (DUF58 family)|nr:DUF58 domain-containing protein [Pirellulaceae bacterium]
MSRNSLPPAGRQQSSSVSSPGTSRASAPGSFIDPAALMRIKNLEVRARLVVQGFLSGLHKSPYHGFSVEFTEYRQYTPGDDLRYLDWRLFARTDRYYLKRFEDETNLRCHLLVDLSRSMGYGSLAYDKAQYAKTAAATIGYFLTLQRDAIGLVAFDAEIQEVLPARYRPGHLHRLLLALERSPGGKSTNLADPLEQIAQTATKRGLVILLSDLLAPVESIEKQLGYLRSRGHEVVVLRILDPAEVAFPFAEAAQFEDLETGRELYVDPESVRARYRERFNAHAGELARVCNRAGIDLYTLQTDQPLELALFDLLNSRLRRGRQVARRAGPGQRAAGGSR